MIETLLHWDQSLFLFFNELHHPVVDPIMVFFSAKLVWIPFYAFLLYLLYRRFNTKVIYAIVAITLTITVADRLTSGIMKPGFERLRPCHEPALAEQINIVDSCGGRFGFPSSHAANSFALAFFFVAIFGYKSSAKWLLLWAFVVSYSRVYLGVHYPVDILVGGMVGAMIGWGIGHLLIRTIEGKTEDFKGNSI